MVHKLCSHPGNAQFFTGQEIEFFSVCYNKFNTSPSYIHHKGRFINRQVYTVLNGKTNKLSFYPARDCIYLQPNFINSPLNKFSPVFSFPNGTGCKCQNLFGI